MSVSLPHRGGGAASASITLGLTAWRASPAPVAAPSLRKSRRVGSTLMTYVQEECAHVKFYGSIALRPGARISRSARLLAPADCLGQPRAGLALPQLAHGQLLDQLGQHGAVDERDRGVVGDPDRSLGEAAVREKEGAVGAAGGDLLVQVAHRLLADLVTAALDRDLGALVVAVELEVGLRVGRVVDPVDGVAVAPEEVEQHGLVGLVVHPPDGVDDLGPLGLAGL